PGQRAAAALTDAGWGDQEPAPARVAPDPSPASPAATARLPARPASWATLARQPEVAPVATVTHRDQRLPACAGLSPAPPRGVAVNRSPPPSTARQLDGLQEPPTSAIQPRYSAGAPAARETA